MDNRTGTKRVIVNADDFGFSPGVTEGIVRAHREGIVTSTTIMANMPAAEDAARLARDVPSLGVGVHLNICQGRPLSSLALSLADEDGVMRLSANRVLWLCATRPRLLRAVEAEFDAQVRWVLDHGIQPTHLDSHRHTHGYPPIFLRAARLARRYNIRFLRRHREVLPGRDWPAGDPKRRRIRRMLNVLGWVNARLAPRLLATTGTWGMAQTGVIDAAWLIRVAAAAPAGVTEIMTHPGLAVGLDEEASRLRESRERELAAVCDPAVREAFRRHGVELVHYGQL